MGGFSITFLVITAISIIVSIVAERNIMFVMFILGFPLTAVALVFWAVYYQVKLGINEPKKVWTEEELEEYRERKRNDDFFDDGGLSAGDPYDRQGLFDW